jgi:hypothetical protein
MPVPRQMTAHTLEAPKGWPSPHAVDFASKISANVTIDPVFAGRCVHLNAVGEFEMGVPDDVGDCSMPIFLFQNSDDPDVENPGGDPATEKGVWVAVAPTGKIMGLVAAGAYELETTEFEPNATAGAYVPGDALHAIPDNANAVTGGRLTRNGIDAYDHHLVGIVSRGEFENSHQQNALAFWPYNLPRQA